MTVKYRPFFKYFNLSAAAEEADIHLLKVCRNLKGELAKGDSMTAEEKRKFISCFQGPVKEMFEKFGYEVNFSKKDASEKILS